MADANPTPSQGPGAQGAPQQPEAPRYSKMGLWFALAAIIVCLAVGTWAATKRPHEDKVGDAGQGMEHLAKPANALLA